jgi:hypothetical protein
MPLIQPPPERPKKVTTAVRLDETVLAELRIYGIFLGTRNNSHIISESLTRIFKLDTHYKAWRKAHPDIQSEINPHHNGATRPKSRAVLSDAVASSVVAAAEAANDHEG